MGYKIHVEGFEGQEMEIVVGFWTGPKLLVNGKKAQKGHRIGNLLLKRDDGREVVATLKKQLWGVDVPKIEVDGELIEIVKPLTWQQWLFASSPFVILLLSSPLGGDTLGSLVALISDMLGGVIALIGFFINVRLFRSEMHDRTKYVFSIVVTLLLIFSYTAFAVIMVFSLLYLALN